MKFDEKYKGKNMDKDLLEIQKISRVTVEFFLNFTIDRFISDTEGCS